jgi:hypothetical protein
MIDKLNEYIEEEINKRVSEFRDEFNITKTKLDNAIKDLDEFETIINQYKNKDKQFNMLEKFKSFVNKDNFANVIGFFNLQKTCIPVSGMCCDEIPLWFKLLVAYYEDKENLFILMDLFDIQYPDVAKNIKMPYDYNEKELDLIFKYMGKMYVCNGCIYDDNIGFWYREFRSANFNLEELFKKSSYVEIPWQLLLKNKLLSTDKYFEKILNSLKKKESHAHYFFTIQTYQPISIEQSSQMAKYLPKSNLYDVHKEFINNNKDIIKNNQDLAEFFIDNINDNQYSTFYYLNYPLEIQKDFIRKYKNTYYKQLDLIKRMSISKEEKLEFLNELAKTAIE